MKIETDWANIPQGFYLRREFHAGLGGTYVYTLQVKLNDEPPFNQPHVPAHEDSWRHSATTHTFWNWAKASLPIYDAPARVQYSEA